VRKKIWISGLIALYLFYSTGLGALATPKLSLWFNNKAQKTDIKMINSKPYVPINDLVKWFGGKISYDSKKGKYSITIEDKNKQIKELNSKLVYAKEEKQTLERKITDLIREKAELQYQYKDLNEKINTRQKKLIEEETRHLAQLKKIDGNLINSKIRDLKNKYPVGYWSDYEYTNELNSMDKEIQYIQDRLNALVLDTSIETSAKKAQLQRELSVKQSEKEEMTTKRSTQLEIRGLEKNFEEHRTKYQQDYKMENELYISTLSKLNN
jgi:DNA repair exonuclease SbcCD ATPase subunit